MNNQKHTQMVREITERFMINGFSVKTELPLPLGKGAVDIFAGRTGKKIYAEIKSGPQSINSKKVISQLTRYRQFFGEDGFYCLISPDALGTPRICSLDRTVNCSLNSYLGQI